MRSPILHHLCSVLNNKIFFFNFCLFCSLLSQTLLFFTRSDQFVLETMSLTDNSSPPSKQAVIIPRLTSRTGDELTQNQKHECVDATFLSWQTIQDQAAVVIVFCTWNFPRVCICLEMSADNQLGTWTLSRQSQLAHGTSPEASTFHFQFLTYSST